MKKFLKASAVVTAIVLAGKILGLLREMLMADIFGTGEGLDIFLLVSSIPIVIFYLIGNGVTASLLPLLKQCKTECFSNKKIYCSFATYAFIILLVGGMVLFVAGQLFAHEIVLVVAPGFSEESVGLAVEFLRFFLLLVFFLGFEGVSISILQLNNRIFVPPIANLLYGVSMLLPMIFLKDSLDLSLLAVILVVAYCVRSLTCIVCLFFTDYRPRFVFSEAKPYILKLAKLAPPVILATVLLEVNFMIDKSFASLVCVGAISALNYSEKVVTLITGTLFSALGFVFFPTIVNKYVDDRKSFRSVSNRVLQFVLVCGLACSVFCLFEARNINIALFMGGAFDEQSLDMTTTALVFYAFAIVTSLLRDVLKKISFAMRNTRIPLVGSAINCAVNVALMIVLVPMFGLAMIALSTTIASLIEMFYLILVLNTKEHILEVPQFVLNLAYSLGVTVLICALVVQVPVSFSGSLRLDAFMSLGIHGVLFCVASFIAFIPLMKMSVNNALLKGGIR